MLSFLDESAKGKNMHLEHLEDEVFNSGVDGARSSILFLRSLRDMLAGHTPNRVSITTKFDGSPAIFAGINPANKKFFVGTKAVFVKAAKLNYTEADIDLNYGQMPGLARKLKIALEYLPQLGITGVWQGDMMFTREDLKDVVIDGERVLLFQPNTIAYTVPYDSQLSHNIQRAHIGIVWHTQYHGDKLEDMVASFLPNIHQLNITPDVWFRDAQFIDASGTATFSQQDSDYLTSLLSAAGSLFQRMDPRVLNYIAQNNNIRTQIIMFNNSRVRSGEGFGEPSAHVNALMHWVSERSNKHILDAQQAPTKVNREQKKNEYLRFYKSNFYALVTIFQMVAYIVEAKNYIIRKLQSVKGMGTFLRTEYGYKVTSPEGFVAIDHKGNAIKLVDRLEFTKANFNAAKAWDQ